MRGRGIDFEHRFNTSRWAENLLIVALGEAHGLLTVRFGLSEVRRNNEIIADRTDYKDPDLLTYELKSLTPSERRTLNETDLEHFSRCYRSFRKAP